MPKKLLTRAPSRVSHPFRSPRRGLTQRPSPAAAAGPQRGSAAADPAGGDPARVCINGKWLSQSPSGTQRYATEVIRTISASPEAAQMTLILPRDAVEPPWSACFRRVRSRFRGVLFEQVALPWLARGKHLFSLTGPAPLVKRDQTVVMHDAGPFRFPGTYRLAFILWYRLLYGVLTRTAGRVLTVSAFSRSELARVFNVPEHRFELAPCGGDHVEHAGPDGPGEPLPFEAGSFALIVGNLAPHKNVNAAVAALARSRVPVVVVGGAQHVFRSVEFDGSESVRFVGRVSDAHLRRLYAAAAVLVAPSRYEGFCIPVVEAGRLGCPAVFATGSAMPEIAGDGGVAFHPDDMATCVHLVTQLIADRGSRDELAARARANAARFTWANTAQVVFGRLLARRGGAAAGAPPRPLRVLHVTETFGGGIRSAILGYANAVRGQGVESSLLGQDRGCGWFEELGESSPFVHVRMVPHGLPNLFRAIGPAVQELRPDIVHLHSSLAGGIGRLRLMFTDGPAVVYSPHCFAFERSDVSRLERWAYRGAEFVLARATTAFVCVSPHEADLARRLRRGTEVAELLNSFDLTGAQSDRTSRIARRALPGAGIGVVTVGRVAPQKGPEMWLDIVSALRGTDRVDATWVGDGMASARERLEANDIAITGWLPVGRVPDVLASHDLYLHTALWEAAVPIAVLEAMQVGVPVVVLRNRAYRSLLPEEWQFDSLAGAVRMIRELTDERSRRRRIQQQFSVLGELRSRSPEHVLAGAYHRIAGKTGMAASEECSQWNLRRTPRETSPTTSQSTEETRWAHRSSAS